MAHHKTDDVQSSHVFYSKQTLLMTARSTITMPLSAAFRQFGIRF